MGASVYTMKLQGLIIHHSAPIRIHSPNLNYPFPKKPNPKPSMSNLIAMNERKTGKRALFTKTPIYFSSFATTVKSSHRTQAKNLDMSSEKHCIPSTPYYALLQTWRRRKLEKHVGSKILSEKRSSINFRLFCLLISEVLSIDLESQTTN